jgi:hypothetical protein
MNMFRTGFTAGLAVAAAVGFAPAANADPSEWPAPGSQPADVILMQLERDGYAVGINWINGRDGAPLSRCQVTGYHAPGRTDGVDPAATTVYMDVSCPYED